ncbi:SPOR domain-containing protein [Accumulibacter sp.]|uniref:SPOR domain-containing protein n=1 Tax=Accumulibacter sp. TaxID=2053492 RepID=UPI0025EA3F6E|nr:SPOR domain-containing protein [Accumulibacter sp.]MCM8594596.1 SPOR domain-containing protein [Accumulibacter sp.]MDS4048742.1 SPOR domain-containing protein [Accumulibacter sp.]
MRVAVFLLVLANLLFFVWSRGYLGSPANPDERRMSLQLLADQIRVVARDDPPAPPAKNAGGERKVSAKNGEVCAQWTDLASTDADRIEKLVGEQFAAFRVRRNVSESSGYWVFIPPQGSKEEANRKTAELEELGITDYLIIQAGGPNQWAVSLGTYRTEEAANLGLEVLRAKGVKSARMGERKTRPASTTLEISGPGGQADALHRAIGALVPKAGPVACKVKVEGSR